MTHFLRGARGIMLKGNDLPIVLPHIVAMGLITLVVGLSASGATGPPSIEPRGASVHRREGKSAARRGGTRTVSGEGRGCFFLLHRGCGNSPRRQAAGMGMLCALTALDIVRYFFEDAFWHSCWSLDRHFPDLPSLAQELNDE